MNKIINYSIVLTIFLLVIGLYDLLPIRYYTFLRIFVFIVSIACVYEEYRLSRDLTPWGIVFCVVGILFNPIFPIYLGKRLLWMPIDIIAAILFFVYLLNKEREEQNSTSER